MRQSVRRWIKISAGIVLIVLGVIGLVTPGLQGILFTIIGLKLITDESALARKWARKIKERLPAGARQWLDKHRPWRRTDDPA